MAPAIWFDESIASIRGLELAEHDGLHLAWAEAAREAARESRRLKHHPYLDPPSHLARESDRKAGGLTAIGITNTKLGDAVEHKLQEHYGLEDAHPGRRQGPFDVRDGPDAYEVKAVTREASEYKAAPKKSEVEGKLAHAREHGLNPHTMIVVHDRNGNQMHVYSKPGVGYYRLPLQAGHERGWRYHGVVPFEPGADLAELLTVLTNSFEGFSQFSESGSNHGIVPAAIDPNIDSLPPDHEVSRLLSAQGIPVENSDQLSDVGPALDVPGSVRNAEVPPSSAGTSGIGVDIHEADSSFSVDQVQDSLIVGADAELKAGREGSSPVGFDAETPLSVDKPSEPVAESIVHDDELTLAWSAEARARSLEVRRAKKRPRAEEHIKELVDKIDPNTVRPPDVIAVGHWILSAVYNKIPRELDNERKAAGGWENAVHLGRNAEREFALHVGYSTGRLPSGYNKGGRQWEHDMVEHLDGERLYLWDKYVKAMSGLPELAKRFHKARQTRITAQQNALKEVLETIRPMGGKFQRPKLDIMSDPDPVTGAHHLVQSITQERRPEVERKFNMVEPHFPSDWIAASNKHGSMSGEVHRKGTIDGRGHYTHTVGRVTGLPAFNPDVEPDDTLSRTGSIIGHGAVHMETPTWRKKEGTTVARHELSHRMEYVVPNLQRLEHEYWTERTSGNVRPLRELNPHAGYEGWEQSDPDEFVTPYAGKVYPRSPLEHLPLAGYPDVAVERHHAPERQMSGELFTVGQQGLWDDFRQLHTQDRQHTAFIAGLNAIL